MATQGRDVTIGILTDTSQFDVERPAKELEELGENAEKAARDIDKSTDELKRLAAQGKDAQRELDRLNAEVADNNFDRMGRDAKVTAAKVDDAFDSIGRSAKKVSKDIDKAGHEGFEEFKDEAASSGREAAASFSGEFSDVGDLIQEVAANAFSGFGPLGTTAGIAAAAGIGLIVKAFGDAKAAAEAAKQQAVDYFDALVQGGGKVNLLDQVQRALETTEDSFKTILIAAKQFGISQADIALALGGSLPAYKRVTSAIASLRAEQMRIGQDSGFADQSALNIALLDQMASAVNKANAGMEDGTDRFTLLTAAAHQLGLGFDGVALKADETVNSFEGVTKATEEDTEAQKEHQRALEESASAIDAFTDPINVYTETLQKKIDKDREAAQATANATKDGKDQWQDYAHNVNLSVDEYLDALERQLAAQRSWATDLATLAKRGVTEGVLAELEKLGPQGAPLVHKLTTASKEELERLVRDFTAAGAGAASGTAAGIDSKAAEVAAAAKRAHDKAKSELDKKITIPVDVGLPPSIGPGSSANAAEHAIAQAQAYAAAHPIYFSTSIKPPPVSGPGSVNAALGGANTTGRRLP